MTDTEIAQLEELLGKLTNHLGASVAIVTRIGIDGFEVATYDTSGKQIANTVAGSLKEAIQNIQQ